VNLLERRNGYTDDIKPSGIYFYPIAVFIVIVIVVALITLFAALEVHADNTNKEVHNEAVTRFNAYTLNERQAIAKFHGVGEESMYGIDPKTYLMTAQPIDRHAVIHWYQKYWLIILISVLVALSWSTFAGYHNEKNSKYYLSDIPLKQPGVLVLFICMFAAWPVFLVNWIYMRFFSKLADEFRQNRQEQREKNAAEYAAIQQIAQSELAELPIERRFSKNAKLTFRRYVEKDAAKAQADRIREAKHKLAEAKQTLTAAGKAVMQAQRQVGAAEANLRTEQTAQAETDFTAQQIERDWEAITRMRGVASINPCYTKVRDKKRPGIEILVKVRVPYEGEFYDFGDYLITFADNTYRCARQRSGVKLNATSHAPNYGSSGFCFGNRSDLIGSYVRHGRIADALDLIIESLHSVNDAETAKKIPECFRKVKTIERAERRLKVSRIFEKEG